MAPEFEKANEIYFRLGIIYKQQQKFSQSLDVSDTVLQPSPPGEFAQLTLAFVSRSVSNTSSMTLHAR